jgi:hypothetical protein
MAGIGSRPLVGRLQRQLKSKGKKQMSLAERRIIEQSGFVVGEIATRDLSVADLLALPTPVPMIPAPAADEVIFVLSLFLDYKAGATPYTLGNADNSFGLVYHGETDAIATQGAAGLADQAASQVVGSAGVFDAVAPTANAKGLGVDIVLQGTAPALTLGDGLVRITALFVKLKIQP